MPDEVQMPLFESETPSSSDVRREEERSDRVQAVQYCRFPRVYADQRFRTAFTRDVSDSGLCVRVDEPEPIGALLRVIPRGVDGEPETERIGRVAWTRPTADGGRWLGIALLESGQREPVRVPAVRRPNPRKKQA